MWDKKKGLPDCFSGYFHYTPFGMKNPYGRNLEEVWYHPILVTTPKVLIEENYADT